MRITLISMLLLSTCAWAQNPVSDALRHELAVRAKNTVAAGEEMPADKFAYKPTPAQVPFGHWLAHASGANYFFCSRLTGQTAPEAGVKETDSKEKLVAALKKSFAYCEAQLPQLQDGQMGEEISFFGNRKVTKGAAVLDFSADLADHYAQMAMYLRLNGLLPPTARK